MLDLFDSLSVEKRDDRLALLYKSNTKNLVSVSTPYGLTERQPIESIVQQGGTWGPILCSNSIDTLGKQIWKTDEMIYMYKKTVRILPLAMVDDIMAVSLCGTNSLLLNTYINTKIELKKLRFHTPDKEGKTKCHKLHIGKEKRFCPHLKVHGSLMENVDSDEYLGDVISKDGKNRNNIQKRITRGYGIITEIMKILEQTSHGYYYIEIALLLRDALFLGSVLNNVEIMYNLTEKELSEFDALDLLLLRRILNAPSSTPKEAFYLELGLIPASTQIKARRIKYLHYLLNKKKSEMISMFFTTQWRKPDKGDWVYSVQNDLHEFGILADLDSITEMPKSTLKTQLKSKAKELTFLYMNRQKEKHSKMANLTYSSFQIQKYLNRGNLHIGDIRIVFLFRVRMLSFWGNFRGNIPGRLCPMCKSHPDKQSLFLQCKVIQENWKPTHEEINNIYSEDISEVNVKQLVKIVNIREEFVKDQ